ncbi:MAG: FHA domain-containing protein, partial [Planctomycetaceae bacterium]|nr:FHA domain-containing protein [Planctomycetaceae bacterium]
MSILQIQFADGTTKDLPLERSQPVSVGRHSTSDIQIDEDAVAVLHCRISWNRRHWEVTAASAGGVEVNGTIVRHAPLTERDLIRVGSVDLRLLPASETSSQRGSTSRGAGAASLPASDELTTSPADSITRDSGSPSPSRQTPSAGWNARSEEIPLRPLTEEEIVYRLETDSAETQAAGTSQQGSPDQPGELFHDEFSRATEPDSDRNDRGAPESFLSDHSPGQSPTAERPATPRPSLTRQKDFRQDGTAADSSTRAARPGEDRHASEGRHAGEARSPREAEDHTAAGDDSSPETDESPPEEKPRESLLHQARHSRRDRQPRPGERDALRSPLVLGLGGGVLALLLGAATLWFTIGRQASSQQYSTALEHLNSGQFAQAAKEFQQILDERPNARFSQEARIGLGRARIGQKIGAAPADWAAGLEELESFIRQQRDLAGFDELKEQVEKFARDISAGAATAAGQRASRSLLETSTAAERLALQYAGEDSDTDGFLAEMADLRKKSLRLIRRHEGLQAALAAIQQANTEQKPLAALAARRDLLARWPDLESLPEVRRLLRKSLETEQALVRRTEPAITALTTEPAAPQPVHVLARHTRARTDEPADGTIVIATTRAACFGIDLITGTPVWRKPLGDSSVFFPREVTSVVPALLLYDAQAAELQLVRQTTGAILWRLPLTSRPRGAPLIHEGQIYLATTAGELLQIDLHAGTLA